MKTLTPLMLLLLMGAWGCDSDDDGADVDAGVLPQFVSIEVQPQSLNLLLGEEVQMRAIATFDDGQQRDITRAATWFLDTGGEALIELLEDGKIRALTAGATRIGANIEGNDPDKYGAAHINTMALELMTLSVSPNGAYLEIGESVTLRAVGAYNDGHSEDLTDRVTWISSAPDVMGISGDQLTAAAHGEAEISAEFEGHITRFKAETLRLVELRTSPNPIQIGVNQAISLSARGVFNNGRTQDLSGDVEWSSADLLVARFDEAQPNQIIGVGDGFTQVHAAYGELSVTIDATVGSCVYPSYPDTVRFNKTVPPLYWESAFTDGHKEFEFKLEDVYCDHEEYGHVSIIAFVVGAGWCSACTYYTTEVLEPEKEALEGAGVLFIFLEAQDYDYMPTDSQFADDHLTGLIGSRFGIRVGSLDTRPVPNYLTEETDGYVQAFPTVFVVRRSDMKIIADGTRSQNYLPLLDIARAPNQDWSNPDSRFVSRCGPTDEEPLEPNNNPVDAPTIGEGSFNGGICDAQPDYYRVDIDGPWRLDLNFSHDTGNLDVWIWDEGQGAPLLADGEPVGSYSDDDNETLEHEGPALIRVEGVQGDSAPYDLSLSAR